MFWLSRARPGGYFNPRSREGSDDVLVEPSTARRHFNPRSREGSDPGGPWPQAALEEFQSTLPRRERQKILIVCEALFHISIHAPAKGATYAIRSATAATANFNPRSREGSDFTLWWFPAR